MSNYVTLITVAGLGGIAVASQILIAALVDHFGLLGAAVRPLDLSRFLGIGILILGVWLIVR
jgi:transporter family-2 protein